MIHFVTIVEGRPLFFCGGTHHTGVQPHSIKFNSLSKKSPLQGVNHMDMEIVREYVHIYKVTQIIVEYSVSQLG